MATLTELDSPSVDGPDRGGIEDTGGAAMEAISTDAAIKLIATLPRDQAEAVLLRVVVGLDARSAAEVLGKRSGAVRTASYRGLRRLAQRLQGQHHQPFSEQSSETE